MVGLWICLVNVSHGFEKASGSKYAKVLNTRCWICLEKPDCALIMSQYEWICLNSTESDWIGRHKPEKTECWICQNILNVSDDTLLDTLQTTFWMASLTQWWTQSGSFFDFQKGQGTPPLSSLVAHLWVWLNMHQYPWICLNILENAWINRSNNVRALNMHDHLIWLTDFWSPVLNKPGFWIWHGCICKNYIEFRICLIMAPYASIMSEYASICLNVPQYAWTWLNIA